MSSNIPRSPNEMEIYKYPFRIRFPYGMVPCLAVSLPNDLGYGKVYPYGQRYNVDNNMISAKLRITYDSTTVATVSSTDQNYQPT